MRVLITVKAAPNPSATYGETVCVAGLRLDPGHEAWVRLYPINFRFIEENHAFSKYDVVSLEATPANESRFESWKPRIDTIKREHHLRDWSKRMPYLGPFAHATMCDLNARALHGGPSLGLVRARRVSGLTIEDHPGWTSDQRQKIAAFVGQPELFDSGKPKTALEAPRFVAHYRWHCPADTCTGHNQQLLDWEFTAFQRRLPGGAEEARTSIRKRWYEQICALHKNVHFYVGNQAKRPQTFSILGIVYPSR
jgi:hypothetical protein